MKKSPVSGFNPFRKPTLKMNAAPRIRSEIVELPKPKIGDRVQVPNGFGTVVETSGDMFLIDLENQAANLWERLRSIKFQARP